MKKKNEFIGYIITYKTNDKLKYHSNELNYPEFRIEFNEKKLRAIYIFDDPPISNDLLFQICSRQQLYEDGWVIVCSSEQKKDIVSTLSKVYKDSFKDISIIVENKNEVVNFWSQILINNFSNLTGKENITIQFTIFEVVKMILSKNNEGISMVEENFVKEFWYRDPSIKQLMLHSYLLGNDNNFANKSIRNELKKRTGAKTSEFETRCDILKKVNILEIGESYKLQKNNNIYEQVENLIMNEFEIKQKIHNVTGMDLLNISYDGRPTMDKKFSDIVISYFEEKLPYIRSNPISTSPYTYELFLPGKWILILVIKTSSKPITEQNVALANVHKESMNKWLVYRSAFSAVIGPSFAKESVLMAKKMNVTLIDTASLLKLTNFLSQLNNSIRENMHDYIPLIFSFSAGLISIDNSISNLQLVVEEKKK